MVDVIGGIIQNLEECEKSIQGVQIESPFVNGCDLDWDDPQQVEDIMKTYDEANEFGAEPSTIRRV